MGKDAQRNVLAPGARLETARVCLIAGSGLACKASLFSGWYKYRGVGSSCTALYPSRGARQLLSGMAGADEVLCSRATGVS